MNEIPLQVVNGPQNTVDIEAKVVNGPKVDRRKFNKQLFKKGVAANPNGRPVGSVNEKTKLWEALGNDLTTIHAQKFNEVLSEMMEHNPEKGMYIYLQVLEYFKPKLNRTTLSGDADNPVFIAPAKFE